MIFPVANKSKPVIYGLDLPASVCNKTQYSIYGLVQERRNSSASAMELRLSCSNPSVWSVCIIKLVHDVSASGRVCVGSKFELEFGRQFGVTSTNMADVIHTMTDA